MVFFFDSENIICSLHLFFVVIITPSESTIEYIFLILSIYSTIFNLVIEEIDSLDPKIAKLFLLPTKLLLTISILFCK